MALTLRRIVLLLVLTLTACAAPGPPYASVEGTLRPVPPGAARIFFYRNLEPYETTAQTTLYLNNQPVAESQTGSVLYRNVEPGQYVIRARSYSRFPNDTKTVALRPGQVIYVRIDSLKSWTTCAYADSGCFETFVVNLVDPRAAEYEMRDLRMIPG
jgi:hypothetical protein